MMRSRLVKESLRLIHSVKLTSEYSVGLILWLSTENGTVSAAS